MKIFKNLDARLIIVPTPIGNLGDITRRSIEALVSADIVYCEDTRRAMILLGHLGISPKLESLHGHSARGKIFEIIRNLNEGKRIAYISDSGTPGISDPGASLVKFAQEHDIPVSVLPGAAAFVPAVIMSGLRCDRFAFIGFLSPSSAKRCKILRSLANIELTIVIYETPHRIQKTLADCLKTLGDRNCAVVREISKIHEEVIQGKISEIIEYFSKTKPKGEMVLVIDGTPPEKTNI